MTETEREELAEALKEALIAIDEAYTATGFIKVARTSTQRMKIEEAAAALIRSNGRDDGDEPVKTKGSTQ